MMTTTNAVRWNKVATHCCVCGLPLVDATSVEFGIGPVCRRKYNYEDAYAISPDTGAEVSLFLAEQNFPHDVALGVDAAVEADDSRKAANKLVYYASAEQGEAAILAAHALRLLGYTALADRIQDRLLAVSLKRTPEGMVAVTTPYNPAFIGALRVKFVGQKWDRENKVWLLPDTQEAFDHLSNALAVYAGQWAVGPNGPFKV